jgi:transposase InsO family protein
MTRGHCWPVRERVIQRRGSNGSRRKAKPLQAEGLTVGRSHAQHSMPVAGVAVQPRRRCPLTTDSRRGDAVAPNLVARQCNGALSDTVWMGDIPDLWTAEGW